MHSNINTAVPKPLAKGFKRILKIRIQYGNYIPINWDKEFKIHINI